MPKITKMFSGLAVFVMHGFAKSKYDKKQFPGAIRLLDKCLRHDPVFGLGYFNRGMAHFCLNSFEKALEDFQQAAFHMNDPFCAYLAMAEALEKLSRAKEAVQALESAIEHYDPGFWEHESPVDLYLRLAKLCQEIPDFPRAISWLNAVPVQHHTPDTWLMLARCYEQIGDKASALACDQNSVIAQRFDEERCNRLIEIFKHSIAEEKEEA